LDGKCVLYCGAVTRPPAPRLNILGSVEFITPAGEKKDLSGKNAALICKLALSRDPVPARLLSRLLWEVDDKTSLQTAVTALRRIEVPVNWSNDCYSLDLDPAHIDACLFRDRAPQAREPAEINELLGLWRQDPRWLHIPDLDKTVWNETIRARDKLLRTISELPPGLRESIGELDRFVDLFPFDEEVRRIRETWQPAPPKPRLLIVDDRIGHALATLLPDYDCKVVASYEEWKVLTAEGRRLNFDAALIDFHLTEMGDDQLGGFVLAHLQDNYNIPTVLMSVDPPTGWLPEVQERYGVVGIYHKEGPDKFDGLRKVISDLLKPKAT